MKRVNKKIVIGAAALIMGLNLLMQKNVRRSEIDLNTISNMAMATGEEDPDENPIIIPTSWIDWLGELIGF